MAYIPPSQRNKKSNDNEIKKPSAVIKCKWCHQNDHLSINCKFKGTIQEEKPDILDNTFFPELQKNIQFSSSTSTSNWIDQDKIKKVMTEDKDKTLALKRVSSSNISLDTAVSNYSELDLDEINNIIISNIHPYTSYYKYTSEFTEDLYTTEFNQWWYSTHVPPS